MRMVRWRGVQVFRTPVRTRSFDAIAHGAENPLRVRPRSHQGKNISSPNTRYTSPPGRCSLRLSQHMNLSRYRALYMRCSVSQGFVVCCRGVGVKPKQRARDAPLSRLDLVARAPTGRVTSGCRRRRRKTAGPAGGRRLAKAPADLRVATGRAALACCRRLPG